jgi:hypothetical protein
MNGEAVYLSQPVEGVTAGSSVVFRCTPNEDLVCTVASATSPVQPGVLDIPAAGSLLRLMDGKWHKSVNVNGDSPITLLRQTSALLPSHELVLAEVPIPDPVGGDRNAAASSDEIELDGLYPELDAGRSVVLSGERYYPSGVRGQEFARVRYVSHRLSERPNDSVHTFVRLERPIRQSYRRSKLQILANVVAATHGKSVTSIIGHGDATQRFQSMPLDQGPLTYLPAANETGVNSTLEVRVNELRWHETDSLLVSKAAARDYVILQFGDGKQAVQFGDGKTGARLPTGNSNVVANYRIGLGSSGNVKPNSITQLISRPLGIKEVTNPLPATGGADPEGIDQIRANAPIAVMALDRLVSVRDYADFARNYAGIDKAIAATIQISGQSYVGVTVAGAADIPIEGSDLMMNLGQAYRHLGDPLQPVIVKERDLLRLFIAANVKLKPDYDWAFVHPKLRQKLFDSFAFARRELGQDLYLSEVYSAIHSVEGVALATIELFATTSQNDLEQDLTKQDGSDGFFNYLSDARTKHPTRLPAHTGKVIGDQFKPAQLIYLSRDVPDSLLLTEIKS